MGFNSAFKRLNLRHSDDTFFVHPVSLSLANSTCYPVSKTSLNKFGVNRSEWRVSVYGLFTECQCRDSSIDISTRYELHGPGIESRWG